MPHSVTERIRTFNQGRDPERLAMKFAAMRQDAFTFLRGTCHLFYEDLEPADLPKAPLVWCCGDLHLQNFGTYKGDNRLAYFDLNDFDEACLAPATYDLSRFLTSVVIGGKTLGIDGRAVKAMLHDILAGYAAALKSGKARWLERSTADGVIRSLLTQIKKRTRKKFLATRIKLVNRKPRLLIDGQRTLPLEKGQAAKLRRFTAEFARRQPDPAFFRLLDAARRIAGTGSLGLERYALLVEGRGSPHGYFLLDLKHQPGSCVVEAAAKHLPKQPAWKSEAQRVAITQHDVQAVSPALLQAVSFEGRSFLIHELMPLNDRLDLTHWRSDTAGFEGAMRAMGEIVGWDSLRSSGRRGSAAAEELMAFGHDAAWGQKLLPYAFHCAASTEKQWQEFVETTAPAPTARFSVASKRRR